MNMIYMLPDLSGSGVCNVTLPWLIQYRKCDVPFYKLMFYSLYTCTTKLLGGGGGGGGGGRYICFTSSVCLYVCPSIRPTCLVYSVTRTVPDGFFPYLAQMLTSMRGCVAHNDLWLSPISSRSFSYDLAIKLPKYGTSSCVHSTACTFSLDFFPVWGKWSLAWEGVLIGQRSRSHGLFEFLWSGQGYPSRSLIYNF